MIRRHLATIDGTLSWAWWGLRPVYTSGAVSANADDLRGVAHLQLQQVDLLPEEALRRLATSGAA